VRISFAASEEQLREALQRMKDAMEKMMNWPGVLHNDKDVFNKIESAKRLSKPIDGHAPGLKGENARAYTSAGISTDHECFTIEEALDKLNAGMKILIREGSAAKNFEALADLINDFEDYTMFCSDDKHPDNLVEHHINDLVKRAVAKGIDLFKVLKTACINPMVHYGLEVGILRSGDAADFIIVENLSEFKVKRTYINGKLVAEDGSTKIKQVETSIINNFKVKHKSPDDFIIKGNSRIFPVIEAMDGQLVTNKLDLPVPLEDGIYSTDPENDILKIIVLNRYEDKVPAVAFIRNFGLKRGAIASSVAHDSHNIIAVGVDDVSLAKAVNLIISAKGGISAVDDNIQKILELPVAGLMSAYDGYEVAKKYSEIDKVAKEMGSTLNSPFMTLSFMALLVIPKLKLSDHGLFNGEKFEYLEMERE
jgi:adenine deaminase